MASLEAKKQTKYDTKKRTKKPIINPKKGQPISGQDNSDRYLEKYTLERQNL